MSADAFIRPNESAVATPGMAAFLTWKQAEVLLIVADGPKLLDEIGEVAREVYAMDVAQGNRPLYWGVTNAAMQSTLAALERRALVAYDGRRWRLTMKGHEAAEVVR